MLIVEAKCIAGDNISDVVLEGIRLAKILQCCVRVTFNGVNVEVMSYSEHLQTVNAYYDAVRTGSTFVIGGRAGPPERTSRPNGGSHG